MNLLFLTAHLLFKCYKYSFVLEIMDWAAEYFKVGKKGQKLVFLRREFKYVVALRSQLLNCQISMYYVCQFL